MPRPPSKVILWSLLTVLLLLGGGAIWIHSAAAARWSRMERRVAELRSAEASAENKKLPSRGNPDPGEAWDSYVQALLLVHQGKPYSEVWFRFDDSPRAPVQAPPTSETDSYLKGHQKTLAQLRQGSRRTVFRRPQGLFVWAYDPNTGDVPAQFLASLAQWEAKRLQREGASDEAADLLLDALEFVSRTAAQCGRQEYLSALEEMAHLLDHLARLVRTRRLTDAKLKQLESCLASLEQTLPSFREALRYDERLIGDAILRGVEVSRYPGSVRGLSAYQGGLPDRRSWRFGFSRRLALAAGFEWLDFWTDRLVDADALPWADIQSRIGDFAQAKVGHGTAVTSVFIDAIDPAGLRRQRLVRTYFRLLMTVLPTLRSEMPVERGDPFGSVLHMQSTDEGFKVWSVGGDGVDNGGSGEWGDEQDIVLFLPSKS